MAASYLTSSSMDHKTKDNFCLDDVKISRSKPKSSSYVHTPKSACDEYNCIDEVDQRLFLGDKNSATDLELLARLEISHILTVELIPLPRLVTSAFPNLAIMQVAVADLPEADLLSEFESAIQFIEEGLRTKGVLVHCYHGLSRSATLVAAYLMKSKHFSWQAAIQFIRSRRPSVEPNKGFRRQLMIFDKMSCSLDSSYKPFKLYKLVNIHNFVKQTKVLPPKNKLPISDDGINGMSGHPPMETLYRCKKCRKPLGKSRHIFPHSPGQRITWDSLMDWNPDTAMECRKGVFMEPRPTTMANVHKVTSASHLYCITCDNLIGCFSWESNVACACGSTLAPAFWLSLDYVDRITMKKDIEAVL